MQCEAFGCRGTPPGCGTLCSTRGLSSDGGELISLHTWVCTCVHVHTHHPCIHSHVHTYTHTYAGIPTCAHTHTYCACAYVHDSVHKYPGTHNTHICVHAASGRHAHEPHAMHLHTCLRAHTCTMCMCACNHAIHLAAHACTMHTLMHIHVCTLICSTHAHVLTPTRASIHTCTGAHSPSQAAGSECLRHPVAGISSQVSGCVLPNPVCSSPPGSFGWLSSPLAPGCEPMCHCLPRPPGLGTCCSPGRQPFAPSSCGSPPLPTVSQEIPPQGASPISQAGSEAPCRPPACPSGGPSSATSPLRLWALEDRARLCPTAWCQAGSWLTVGAHWK
ncbi:uncharacterized protein LOC120582742 [Pteropus medius]|uniref:uncharacterized protein LOC120582742 n=1 Tax=Pteropus vampyrus TaxID=132908 RepID=UPI00196A2DC6|nr:uncharacterized protein LOC120582742 [Pteropus giganteus]